MVLACSVLACYPLPSDCQAFRPLSDLCTQKAQWAEDLSMESGQCLTKSLTGVYVRSSRLSMFNWTCVLSALTTLDSQ